MKFIYSLILLIIVLIKLSSSLELYDIDDEKLMKCNSYCDNQQKDEIYNICNGRKPREDNYARKFQQKCLLFKIYDSKHNDEKMHDPCLGVCEVYSTNGIWPTTKN